MRGSAIQNGHRSMGKDAFHLPEEYRLEVLALAMDGYVRQLHTGIDQLDFAGRNIMLASSPGPSSATKPGRGGLVPVAGLPLPRIVLVDYNQALVFSQAKRLERPPQMDWPQPCNPMMYFWEQPTDDFGGWIAHQWHHNSKYIQEWLKARFGTEEKRKLYAPLEEEPVVRDYDLPEYQ